MRISTRSRCERVKLAGRMGHSNYQIGDTRGGGKVRGARCEVRGGKMRGTGARYQCEAMGNLRGWNVRGATDNWRSRCRYGM